MKKILFSLTIIFVFFACEKTEENDDQNGKKAFDISGQWLANYNNESILWDIDYTLPGHLIEARQDFEYAKGNNLDTTTFFYEDLFDSYAITINRDSSSIYYNDHDFTSIFKIQNDSTLIFPEEYDTTEFKRVTGKILLNSYKEK